MMSNYFSQQVTTFHGKPTPEPGFLAGYALLGGKPPASHPVGCDYTDNEVAWYSKALSF
jgi:hypothetical protein